MTVLTHSRGEYFGLRPMNPMKDLNGVADLIEEAFAADLDRSGKSALRELRWLSRLKPLLWWMVSFSVDHNDFLSGFVWEEDGKIVGNITINRTSPGSRRWLISNLAVSKDYQRRSIGRSLMYAALELVKEHRGESVALQVRANNVPARHLYDQLHFKEISGTAHLTLSQISKAKIRHIYPQLPGGFIVRARTTSSRDMRQAYRLASAATPSITQKEWPLRHRNYRLNSREKITSYFRKLLGSGPVVHWVVEDRQRFVALLDVCPGLFDKRHKIRLIVHPDWRGSLEKPLINQALRYLYPWNHKKVFVKHPTDHIEALQAFQEFGFVEDQTLLWMKRNM